MNLIYIRTSTTAQDFSYQEKALMKYMKGVEDNDYKIFVDQQTGTTMKRDHLLSLERTIKEGDVVYITELSRLGRNSLGVSKWIEMLIKKKAGLNVLNSKDDMFNFKGR